tara:strand:+ start:6583 stop:7578 length:996 start_codon:yes stop_codon:yes gene_type:complete
MFCDTEEWCRRILEKNFPETRIEKDVKELANDPERLVPDHDILSCGYPCQPFSVAGLRKGEKDDRHIWPFLFKIIACKRPTWVVCENVYGHVALGLDKVLADLESEGYSTRTFIVPACAKDAPHRRDRLWIIAHSDSKSEPDVSEHEEKRQGKLGERTDIVGDTSSNGRNEIGSDKNQRSTFGQSEEGGMQEPSGRSSSVSSRTTIVENTIGGRCEERDTESEEVSRSLRTSSNVADSESERYRGSSSEERGDEQRIVFSQEQGRSSVGSEAEGRSSSCGQEFWTVEPNVGRVAYGVPRRVDRLKGLGNAIVPQISMQIGLAIKEEIKKNG